MITTKQAMKKVEQLVKIEHSLVLSAYELGFQVGLHDAVMMAEEKLTKKQKKAIKKAMETK